MPWALLCAFVFAWGYPAFKTFLNGGAKGAENFLSGISLINFPVPGLDKAVLKVPPVVAKISAEPAVYTLNWLSATGTSLILTGIVSGLMLGLSFGQLIQIFMNTLKRIRISLLTITAMLALGYTTKFAGLDASMG